MSLKDMPKFNRAVFNHPCISGRACDVCDLLSWVEEAQKRLTTVEDVQVGRIDKIALILDPDIARALHRFLHTGPDMNDSEWEELSIALVEAILAYDGPDGDDGRAFTDASGKPHYEP